jgi:DNA repair protein RadC
MLYIQDEQGVYLPAPKEAIFTAAQRLSSSQLRKGVKILTSDLAKAAIQQKMSGYQCEIFACMFLDGKNSLLAFQEMFRGSINYTCIYPREVVKEALRLNAAAVIFAHNHPSGEVNPSPQDIELTNKLRDILKVIDVRVLDHLIIGETVLSMAASGYLP